jgi:hypothetical protein
VIYICQSYLLPCFFGEGCVCPACFQVHHTSAMSHASSSSGQSSRGKWNDFRFGQDVGLQFLGGASLRIFQLQVWSGCCIAVP